MKVFEVLKKKLIESPILISPNWELPFELIYSACDIVVGVFFRQHKDKVFDSIYYASKTLYNTQMNHTILEKEMLTLVYAFG